MLLSYTTFVAGVSTAVGNTVKIISLHACIVIMYPLYTVVVYFTVGGILCNAVYLPYLHLLLFFLANLTFRNKPIQ